MKDHEYMVYRTFKIVIEADSIEEAHDIANETEMSRWDFDCQEVEPLEGISLTKMAQTTVYVDVECRKCGSRNVKITDADENTYFCRCMDCGHRFEKMRT